MSGDDLEQGRTSVEGLRAKGRSDEDIRQRLGEAGWEPELVDRLLAGPPPASGPQEPRSEDVFAAALIADDDTPASAPVADDDTPAAAETAAETAAEVLSSRDTEDVFAAAVIADDDGPPPAAETVPAAATAAPQPQDSGDVFAAALIADGEDAPEVEHAASAPDASVPEAPSDRERKGKRPRRASRGQRT